MKKNNFKQAFTLVELMVFFIFISLLLAASTPVITKRAKNLPPRIHHGKFVCYGGSYEWYNSSRLISSGSGCKFKPPKRASLFKIELVGGGAGGCEYSNWDEYMETRSGKYTLSGGYEGDGYCDINDGELYDMLYLAPYTYAVSGTPGGKGENTEAKSYTGVASPKMVLNGACAGECWSPTAYECEKTGSRKKTDEEGNYVKDEDGDYVYEDYTYTDTCYTTQEEDGMSGYPTCSECSSYNTTLYGIGTQIANLKNCSADDWCYNIATTALLDPYRTAADAVGRPNSWGTIEDFSTMSAATGVGARGGKGQDFYIDGFIDFCDYSKHDGGGSKCAERTSDEYKKIMGGTLSDKTYTSGIGMKTYLANLFGNYLKKGTTSAAGSCDGWGTIKYKEHPETKVGSATSAYQHGQDGKDVEHYDALMFWGDRCTTNAERAKGGEGGWLKDTGDTIYGTNGTNFGVTLREPYDADKFGIVANYYGPYAPQPGTKRDRIPWLTTATTLNVRWHEVGVGGGAAEYKVAYVSTLADDCVFNVASGGPAIIKGASEKQLESIHQGLTTSLVCNEGTLRVVAEGGKYSTDTSIRHYNGFNYMTHAAVFTNPPTFETYVNGGASPFKPNDVFTKYSLTHSGFGAGGRGTTMIDSCTKPYGKWEVNRVYYDGVDKTDGQTWSQEPCSGVSTNPAESGSGGVIVISW